MNPADALKHELVNVGMVWTVLRLVVFAATLVVAFAFRKRLGPMATALLVGGTVLSAGLELLLPFIRAGINVAYADSPHSARSTAYTVLAGFTTVTGTLARVLIVAAAIVGRQPPVAPPHGGR